MIVRLICLLIGLVVAVSLPFVTFKGGSLTRREQRKRQAIVAVMAAVAFVVYAATMPSFFLNATILTIGWSQWAAVVAILAPLSPTALVPAPAVSARRWPRAPAELTRARFSETRQRRPRCPWGRVPGPRMLVARYPEPWRRPIDRGG